VALAVAVVLAAIASATLYADPGVGGRAPSAPTPVPCGAASTSTIASVDAAVAQGIYAGELHSSEVSADMAHVTGSRVLLGALAANDQMATYAAVHAIVYTPHWHIVRLRVERAGQLIADVGGPDVIAPVAGELRWKGKTIGRYVMSVQDDAGYVKLVSRFIGVPLDLYRSGAFVMGTLLPAPSTVDADASIYADGSSFWIQLLSASAFPSGPLRVALFVPAPTSALTVMSCASVRLQAWGSVAKHVAARLLPLQSHYQDLVDVLHGTTGGLVYVRSGSTHLAGGAGPAQIPAQGSVRFRGHSWAVFSWEPVPSTRVYFLTPAAA
jgi:hypothetical protein